MIVSIVHISDLHRDAGSRITNGVLLDSLRRDRSRHPSEAALGKSDLLVVSGDIVYGVTPSDANADAKLSQQYHEAHEFLVEYANVFLDGRRERIVIVPGNHDVSLPHVLRATEKVDLPDAEDLRKVLAQQMFEDGTKLRWSWSDFTVRRIIDVDEYNRRLAPFASFYQTFYEGTRTFSLDPTKQYAIHDYPELGVVIAGLSSCHENDPYNRTGRIHPECIAAATRHVADFSIRGRIPLAVWHHSLYGGPRDTDYVDVDFLQSLMDGGFALGLHGHQHRPQLLEHKFTADRKRHMVVVSAGTLCGGPRSLPSGRMRAYNLLTIDAESLQCVVSVRDMQNSDFSLPVWGRSYVADFGGSSMSFSLPPRPSPVLPVLQITAEADKLLRVGNERGAYNLIRPHLNDPLARRITIRALTALSDWKEIADVFDTPTSSEEFVGLSEAYYELGRKDDLRILLNSQFALQSSDPGVVQSVSMMRSRLARE